MSMNQNMFFFSYNSNSKRWQQFASLFTPCYSDGSVEKQLVPKWHDTIIYISYGENSPVCYNSILKQLKYLNHTDVFNITVKWKSAAIVP